MNNRSLIASLYVVLIAGFGIGLGMLFFEARAEYRQVQIAEAASRQRLADETARLAAQEKILQRLRDDPAYVEKILRTRWGHTKTGEVLYRYPE